jgi:hypothetical protein
MDEAYDFTDPLVRERFFKAYRRLALETERLRKETEAQREVSTEGKTGQTPHVSPPLLPDKGLEPSDSPNT